VGNLEVKHYRNLTPTELRKLSETFNAFARIEKGKFSALFSFKSILLICNSEGNINAVLVKEESRGISSKFLWEKVFDALSLFKEDASEIRRILEEEFSFWVGKK